MQNITHPIEYGLTESNRNENLGWYTNWYTNSNMADLISGMLSVGKQTAINLLFFDKESGKGLNNFRSLESNLKWTADIVDSLENQIVYHPILTLSALGNQDFVEHQLNNVLDGIDGIDSNSGKVAQQYGTPKAIIIPVLMNHNHFGVLTIFPESNDQQTKVYYFNPLGINSSYKDEEKLIFKSLKQRYGIHIEITTNDALAWQNDGNQCGPYAIWFVESVVQHLTENCSSMEEILTDHFAIGSRYDSMSNSVEKQKFLSELEGAKALREHQAAYVEGLQPDHFIQLALQFKKMVRCSGDWYENPTIDFTVQKGTHERVDGKYFKHNGVNIEEIDGVDVFEPQESTVKWLESNVKGLELENPRNAFRFDDNNMPFYRKSENIINFDDKQLLYTPLKAIVKKREEVGASTNNNSQLPDIPNYVKPKITVSHQYLSLTKCAKIAVAGVVVICAAALLHKYISKENWQKLASSSASFGGEGPMSGVL